jgi:hypothetical protein
VTILDAIHDPNLFRSLFKSLDTWRAWLVVLRAVFGLPMEEADGRISERPLIKSEAGGVLKSLMI